MTDQVAIRVQQGRKKTSNYGTLPIFFAKKQRLNITIRNMYKDQEDYKSTKKELWDNTN